MHAWSHTWPAAEEVALSVLWRRRPTETARLSLPPFCCRNVRGHTQRGQIMCVIVSHYLFHSDRKGVGEPRAFLITVIGQHIHFWGRRAGLRSPFTRILWVVRLWINEYHCIIGCLMHFVKSLEVHIPFYLHIFWSCWRSILAYVQKCWSCGIISSICATMQQLWVMNNNRFPGRNVPAQFNKWIHAATITLTGCYHPFKPQGCCDKGSN